MKYATSKLLSRNNGLLIPCDPEDSVSPLLCAIMVRTGDLIAQYWCTTGSLAAIIFSFTAFTAGGV
jgi:hypothetical protein